MKTTFLPAAYRILRALGRPCLRPLAAAALVSTLGCPATQAQDSTLTRLVQKYQYPLTAANGQFGGTGWDKLQQDIQKSTLVLVGEDHGLAQIPQFTQAVAQVLKPKVFVAEIDKYQAQDLHRLAAQPGLPTAFSRQNPMSLSFYSWQEEFQLAQSLRAQQATIVGVDQVNLFNSANMLEKLAAQVKSKPARTALQRQAAAARTSDRQFMVTMQGTPSIYLRPTAADSLRQLVAREKPAVRQLMEEYLTSAAIYRAQNAGAHQTRINLMKRNLLTELQPFTQANQPLPNMLFKFGAYHAGRGRSIWGDIYDVGSAAVTLADAHDQKTLHIFVIGRQGAKLKGFNPDDFSQNAGSYSNVADAWLKPFQPKAANGTAWQVFDLRPVRRALLSDKLALSNAEMEAILLGYDYVVIIPETTASHNF